MRQRWLGVALCGAVFLAGCGDPQSKLAAKAAECQKAFDAMPRERVFFVDSEKHWVKNQQFVTKVDHDVIKTDSLVMPFTGRIDVAQFYGIVTADTQAGAEALPVVDWADGRTRSVRLNFVFKDDGWTFKDGHINYEKGPAPVFTADRPDAFEHAANVFKGDPQLAKCVF